MLYINDHPVKGEYVYCGDRPMVPEGVVIYCNNMKEYLSFRDPIRIMKPFALDLTLETKSPHPVYVDRSDVLGFRTNSPCSSLLYLKPGAIIYADPARKSVVEDQSKLDVRVRVLEFYEGSHGSANRHDRTYLCDMHGLRMLLVPRSEEGEVGCSHKVFLVNKAGLDKTIHQLVTVEPMSDEEHPFLSLEKFLEDNATHSFLSRVNFLWNHYDYALQCYMIARFLGKNATSMDPLSPIPSGAI